MARATRTYDSPLRDEQARLTRRRIVDAAHRMLLEGGYGAMTIAGLAREAGVSVQTVYNAVGGKADIVKAVYDVALAGDDEPMPMSARPIFETIEAAPDGPSCLATYARLGREIFGRVGPLITLVFVEGSGRDGLFSWPRAPGRGYR